MYCVKEIGNSIFWVGASDRRLQLFENAFPIERGINYNSYLIKDEQNVLIDTVDKSVSDRFFENLEYVLDGERLDFLIINHVEPDHSGSIKELIYRYPYLTIVTTAKAKDYLSQFLDIDLSERFIEVKDGYTFSSGKKLYNFISAPMVHWPEVTVVYESTTKTLFSADAFGSFGAMSGNLYADEVDFDRDWLDDARRYYTNIVGKFGSSVTQLLNKASKLEIAMLCPLHGLVWRDKIGYFVDKYKLWASYTPESNGVSIFYGSVYGNTENACNILANYLAEKGIKDIRIFDVSKTDKSVLISECFMVKNLVFAGVTYNGGVFTNLENLILDLKAHNLQNRKIAIIENGTWAATAGKRIEEIFTQMKGCEIVEPKITIKSAVKNEDLAELKTLANNLG